MNKKIFLFGAIILGIMFLFTFSVVKKSAQINIKPTDKPLIEDLSVTLPVNENDPIFGNPGAPATVNEFFSFECEQCAKRHAEIVSFIENNPGKFRLLSKEIAAEDWLGNKKMFPIIALFCAKQQDKYWDFLNQAVKLRNFDETTANKLAIDLKLDTLLFEQCLNNDEYVSVLINEQSNLKNLGFTETPNIFINNKKINLTDEVTLDTILKQVPLQ